MSRTKIFFLLLSLTVSAPIAAVDRIEALIDIRDYTQAAMDARELLANHPDRSDVWELYIKALAQEHNEEQMLQAWKMYRARFPNIPKKTPVLEDVAWGIIEKAISSPQPVVRLYAALAAAFVNQSRSVPVLIKLMKDPQAELRAAAANLAAHFHDLSIQREIPAALSKETHPGVREELIRAMSVVDKKKSEKILKQIIASSSTLAEEKTAAVSALLDRKDLDADEIVPLIQSDRAELRRLACQIAMQTPPDAQRSLLIPLLQDPCPAVRAAAIYAAPPLPEAEIQFEKQLQDIDPQVSIFASRALLLRRKDSGWRWMEKWLQSDRSDLRRLASAALATTGQAGVNLMKKTIESHQDPFVRANIAVGLIGQREHLSGAAEALFAFLNEPDLSICWKTGALLPYLTEARRSPSTFGFSPPEIKSHLVKLQLLKMLSTIDAARTEIYTRKLLKHHSWKISVSAASLLLIDSNPERFLAVEQLLEDPDPQVRVEAALICALFGHEERSLPILEQAYSESDREMKGKILEGIGQIANEQSIPFLIDAWGEPSQILRIIAAAGLLRVI